MVMSTVNVYTLRYSWSGSIVSSCRRYPQVHLPRCFVSVLCPVNGLPFAMIRDQSHSPWPFSRNDSSPHLSDFGRSQYPFLCFFVSSPVSIPYPCNNKTIPVILRYLRKVHWFLGFLLSRHIRSYFQVTTFCSSLLSRSLFFTLSPSLFHYHIPSLTANQKILGSIPRRGTT